jgi:arylsulfatase A
MSHVHGEIVRTPDSAHDSKDLYVDNCSYMDKLVGNLVGELQRQRLSEKTILVFCGDNGTAKSPSEKSTIRGRRLVGQKGTMQEGGAWVPLIVYWPGVTPKGKVIDDLIDSTDFLPTLAEIAGVSLPKGKVFDGRSFVPQLRGEMGNPREWIFIELARNWYVREAGWKLNEAGELFDMSGAPFAELLVLVEKQSPAAAAARQRLQAVLAKLDPAGGILDDGDGTGRHANKPDKKSKKKLK